MHMNIGSSELVSVPLLFAFALGSFDTDLLIILLERRQVLACLAEFTFLHSFSDVPMHEGTLAVHEVKLVVDAREHFGDGRGVADHAHGAHDLRQIATGHHCWRLVIDTALEPSR